MRLRFMFWLDLDKADEQKLAEDIGQLKRERAFVRSVRDGLRLIADLRKGRTEVLNELFPWVLEQPTLDADVVQRPLRKTEQVITQHLSRLEQMILEQGGRPLLPGDATRISLPERPALKDPLADVEITQARNTADNNAAWNLMIASSLQIYGHCDSLPPDMIEYGLRTGRIPPGMVRKKLPEGKSTGGGPKKMDVPQFGPPDFDDDDLLN